MADKRDARNQSYNRNSKRDREYSGSPLRAKYITRQEAADLLRVNPITVDTYYYKGKLTKYKIKGGHRTLYSGEEVRNLIQPMTGPMADNPDTWYKVPYSALQAEFLDRIEAAAFFRVAPRTLDKMAKQGLFTTLRVMGSNQNLYKRAELETLIEPLPRIPEGNYERGARRKWRDIKEIDPTLDGKPVPLPQDPRSVTIREALKRFDEKGRV